MFEEIEGSESRQEASEIGLLDDVAIELCVELGRIDKKVGEVAALKVGSVIKLDRIAGDNMDVVVNGTYLAKGEVVIMEDAYGIRITDIHNE
jgi:flagellar motor switch protein FliN/FliY